MSQHLGVTFHRSSFVELSHYFLKAPYNLEKLNTTRALFEEGLWGELLGLAGLFRVSMELQCQHSDHQHMDDFVV